MSVAGPRFQFSSALIARTLTSVLPSCLSVVPPGIAAEGALRIGLGRAVPRIAEGCGRKSVRFTTPALSRQCANTRPPRAATDLPIAFHSALKRPRGAVVVVVAVAEIAIAPGDLTGRTQGERVRAAEGSRRPCRRR